MTSINSSHASYIRPVCVTQKGGGWVEGVRLGQGRHLSTAQPLIPVHYSTVKGTSTELNIKTARVLASLEHQKKKIKIPGK